MHHAKLFLATTTAISSGSYTLFEVIVKGSTGLLGLVAGSLGVAAGYYAFRTARKNDRNADLQREILEKQNSKL